MKIRNLTLWSLSLLVLAATFTLACQPTSTSQKTTTGPGDPKLTYELVSKDINAYKGKRVRWCGRQLSFESTGKPGGGDFVTRATYANTDKLQSFAGVDAKDMEAFVVEMKSTEMLPKMPSGCVTGTIEGTHTIGLTLGSSSGRESTSPQTVPLLSNPEFEGTESKK